jgi:hypothetical protein
MTEYKLCYIIPKDKTEEFIKKVDKACEKYFFKYSYTITENDSKSNKINLITISTPSCRVSNSCHEDLLYAIHYWDDDKLYDLIVR